MTTVLNTLVITTSIARQEESTIPSTFSLEQNYPNPFNPTTTIRFSLANNEFVSLKIYDVLGKEISTLISEEMNAGTYTVNWNASALPSGVYFYRLQAKNFSETKKLVLTK